MTKNGLPYIAYGVVMLHLLIGFFGLIDKS